ncbi:hypothetical protein JHK85_025270 [Glycine max]|nr:hypothetical protein JHK85_025270 [Glycine max]
MDFLATVAAYPKPDDKIRSTSLKAVRKNIPILIDAERPKEGLDKLLKLADYVVCSAKFPASFIYYAFLATGPSSEEVDVDSLLESLEIKRDKSVSIPTCIS